MNVPLKGVLVTGVDTPVGEMLVRSLLADDSIGQVLAVGSRPPEDALPFSHSGRLTYIQLDLLKERRVKDLLFGPARDLGWRLWFILLLQPMLLR